MIFLFFQGEDGIRDATVTGVQTCALPISAGSRRVAHREECESATPQVGSRRRRERTRQIGRASCREREYSEVVAGSVKKKIGCRRATRNKQDQTIEDGRKARRGAITARAN